MKSLNIIYRIKERRKQRPKREKEVTDITWGENGNDSKRENDQEYNRSYYYSINYLRRWLPHNWKYISIKLRIFAISMLSLWPYEKKELFLFKSTWGGDIIALILKAVTDADTDIEQNYLNELLKTSHNQNS